MFNPYEIIEIVAIYLRKSRENEEDDVLIKHRTELISLAEKFNWKYVIYPEVVSGDTISSRPEMQKLLRDIQEDLYDAVLVVDIDRLGRGEHEDQGLIKKTFTKTNTFIVTPSKLYNLNEESDEDYYDMQAFMARQEYKMIKRRFRRGKKIGSRLGRWTNGIPPMPYVYDPKTKCLLVDDEMNIIYQKMKELFLETSMGTWSIAFEFNRLEYPLPRNRSKRWYNETIRRILVNETHLGKIVSNKTKGSYSKGEKAIKLPRDEWIIIENCHEAVKTVKEHEDILKKLSLLNNTPNRAKQGVFAFSGLVYCSICERRMTFSKNTSDKTYKGGTYIRCGNYGAKGERCKTVGCNEKELLEGLKEYANNFNSNKIKNNMNKPESNDNGLLIIKQKEEKILKDEMDKIFQAYEKGIYTDKEFLIRKTDKQKQLESCQAIIKELSLPIVLSGVSQGEFIEAIEILKKLDTLSFTAINDILRKNFKKFTYTRNSKNDDAQILPVYLPFID